MRAGLSRGVAVAAVVAGLACDMADSAPTSAPATDIEMTISEGRHAGVHHATATDTACIRDIAGVGSWAVQYGHPGAGAPLTSLQLVVPSVADSDRAGRPFYLGLGFGPLLDGSSLEIETRQGAEAPRGQGSLEIQADQSTATFTVSGRTAEQVKISGTIRCNQLRTHN